MKSMSMLRDALVVLCLALLMAGCQTVDRNGTNTEELRILLHPLYGITIDSVEPLDLIVDSISSLSKRPTTRVVFDKWAPASDYIQALNALYPNSYIMGELLDSFDVQDYTTQQYRERVKEYLDAHGNKVDIWEIGNEVNGEWLGNPGQVVSKIENAYHQVNARGYRTALTLYYNKNCWKYASEEMFNWAETRLSADLRKGLDYLLVSYYEEDCNNLKPDWQSVFNQLGEIFPSARLGFGEVGIKDKARKAEYLEDYYTIKIDHPRYVGGHFWWYYKQDMVSKTKPLWLTLDRVLREK